MVEQKDQRPPKALRNAEKRNVTGGEFVPPTDLDGYLDEPTAKFGLWVGETEDEAELEAFEITGEQAREFAEVFEKIADDADELRDE